MTESPSFEICTTLFKARIGGDEMELPVERNEARQITPACRALIIAVVGGFLMKHQIKPGVRGLCAIDGHGVSLRRISLPLATKEEFQRLLRLQLEREFPMPPEQLAWGSRVLRQDISRQEVLVAAIRKDSLQPLIEIFSACGVNPDFTVVALDRVARFETPVGSFGVLHLGNRHSELLIYEDGFPTGIRVLPWGRENLSEAKSANAPVPKIYLTSASDLALLPRVGGVACELLRPAVSPAPAPLILRTQEPPARLTLREARSRKPVVLAAALVIAIIAFPFLQAIVFKPILSHHLTSLKSGRARLQAIDREIDFLQYLKASQPPYMEVIYLVATAASPGTTFDSISMGKRGDLSIRGKMANGQQVTEFRNKLIDGGWFSSVVVEEQVPSPDRRVTVRMSAQLKAAESRKPIPEEPSHK
ncbi:MAG TPA: hypothetical protein VGO67_19105 [Verrucomicrobiae bacterium]|jgi:hypothetical protein